MSKIGKEYGKEFYRRTVIAGISAILMIGALITTVLLNDIIWRIVWGLITFILILSLIGLIDRVKKTAGYILGKSKRG